MYNFAFSNGWMFISAKNQKSKNNEQKHEQNEKTKKTYTENLVSGEENTVSLNHFATYTTVALTSLLIQHDDGAHPNLSTLNITNIVFVLFAGVLVFHMEMSSTQHTIRS